MVDLTIHTNEFSIYNGHVSWALAIGEPNSRLGNWFFCLRLDFKFPFLHVREISRYHSLPGSLVPESNGKSVHLSDFEKGLLDKYNFLILKYYA